ncbi:RNA polymerase sigma factor [Amycolatopsis sp. OK19-0408]|uniref:RNA polymerase sigma factor n=1 Tax=Amycolatopsis iheyensis TaxID=2945988 RepID=A0A9X2SRL9_9PSEU|nr:RNA polymerase sigma factor [Amycolatopsis iheyensis]MCR6490751.1 RNA polymerase sigma factor [Amycolatopsis iheyensis]
MGIERHGKSDRKLLEKNFERSYPDLRAKVLRYVGSRAGGLDCEDIADAVLERLWKRLCRTGPAVRDPEAMAIAIAANVVKDALKKIRPLYTDDVAGIAAGFGFADGGHEDRLDLLTAIEALAPPLREALKLVVLDDQPVARAARILGVDRGVVERRLAKALCELRRRLATDSLTGSA